MEGARGAGEKNMSTKQKKRTWKTNMWGNTKGYEGGRKVEEFGCCANAERWAEEWCKGLSREEAEYAALGIAR